jgi:flagellar basal body-associated protein FliL
MNIVLIFLVIILTPVIFGLAVAIIFHWIVRKNSQLESCLTIANMEDEQ